LETLYQNYKDQGFIVIYAMAENSAGATPTTEELSAFSAEHGLTFPVVADSGWGIGNRFEQDNAIPTYNLLGPGMQVVQVDGGHINDADVEALLPN